MRIVMMGTGGFAVPTFLALLKSAHEVPALFTRPPRPVRGKRKAPVNPMREVAEQHGIPVLMPESIKDASAIEDLRGLAPELLVVCDYGQILSKEGLSAAPLGGINLHASLLPKYRGAAPINWAMYDGEAQTGVTVIHMTAKLDAGPNLAIRTVDIEAAEDAIQLENRLAELGVQPVLESIDALAKWDGESLIGEIQDGAKVTKAPRLKKTDGQIDWHRTAQQIYDQVRAFKPWPATYTHWLREDGQPMRVVFDHVRVEQIPAEQPSSSVVPGEVAVVEKEFFAVGTRQGLLAVQQLQPAGKKMMPAEQFMRGYRVQVGDKFGNPAE